MSIDGTYGFVYCGNRGLGIGVFLIEGQRIQGRDFAGCGYMALPFKMERATHGLAPSTPSCPCRARRGFFWVAGIAPGLTGDDRLPSPPRASGQGARPW
jgi:hypothetical protein